MQLTNPYVLTDTVSELPILVRGLLYMTDRQTFPHLQDSHKCPCADGLECRVTKQLTIPAILGITESITVSFKQCMPVEENVEVEEVELTEE